MNKKVCGICGNYFDENLINCPFCNPNNIGSNPQNLFEGQNTNQPIENQNNNYIDNSNTIEQFGNINKFFIILKKK